MPEQTEARESQVAEVDAVTGAAVTPEKEASELTLEQPIQVVGEHVKSGHKVLAEVDTSDWSFQVRPKWMHLVNDIRDAVEEEKAYRRKTEGTPGSVVPAEALREIEEHEEALAEEEAALPQDETPTVESDPIALLLEDDSISPGMKAFLIAQQEQNKAMRAAIDNLAKTQKDSAEAEKASREKGVIAEAKAEAKVHRDRLKDDITFAMENDVPYPPKKNPRFGDKTPAYVQWLKEYRHDVYVERYGVLEENASITKFDPGAGKDITVKADVARRKVPGTEKIEQDPALSSDMDWNAGQ